MKTVYKLTSYRKSNLYIYATEEEAALYLKLINSKQQANLYKMKPSEPENKLTEEVYSNYR